jgi:dihydrofolate reductase
MTDMPPPALRPPSILSTLTHPLTLLVAISTNPPLGIGHADQLPWPPLKSDLAFFSRVTRRVPKPLPSPTPTTNPTNAATNAPPNTATTVAQDAGGGEGEKKKLNALLMGRRTYFSLPAARRPLISRLSVIITRSPQTLRATIANELESKPPEALKGAEVIVASSVEDGIRQLTEGYGESLGRVFVVGGGEIYQRVLEMEMEREEGVEGAGAGRGVRVVVTEVRKRDGGAFECDTWFPVDLGREEGWMVKGPEEVSGWVGEKVEGGWKGEGDGDGDGGVEVRIVGYERGGEGDGA